MTLATDVSRAIPMILATDVDVFGRLVPEELVVAVKILVILVVAIVANRVLRVLVKRMLSRSLLDSDAKLRRRLRKATPSVLQRSSENRMRAEARLGTLITVSRSITTVVVWFIAIVAALDLVHVNLAPLLASAGIIGVAVGFGAQNIVRDFLAGFFIVVEDQFGVGDIVDLGADAKGTVERVSLRSTRVRDTHGVVWHVPNGQILRVGNKSQLWARAVLDVEVVYDTDVAAAERVIAATAAELAGDPEFAADVLEAPEVWGIEAFTLNGIAIRVVLKTEPASQFRVLRELRGRIAAAFAESGIEFASANPPPPPPPE